MRFENVCPIIHQAVWVERRPLREIAAQLRRKSGHLWAWMQQMRAEYGDPPACRCGRPGLHPGICRAFRSECNPRCPDCGGPAKRSGRSKPSADDMRQRRYLCLDCSRHFASVARTYKRLEDCEAKLVGLRDAGEKIAYIAVVLGVCESTVERWLRLLRFREAAERRQAKGVAA
jgi:transposase-like protein